MTFARQNAEFKMPAKRRLVLMICVVTLAGCVSMAVLATGSRSKNTSSAPRALRPVESAPQRTHTAMKVPPQPKTPHVFAATNELWPDASWSETTPTDAVLSMELLAKARDYALSAGGSGMIIRHGQVVMHWGDQRVRYDIKSATKSIGSTALGLAIDDGKLSLNDLAIERHPRFGEIPESNSGESEDPGEESKAPPDPSWLKRITLHHLATQTSGFDKPGGYEPILFEPGTEWHYSDGGPNWLAECVTLAYRRDIEDLMFERVFSPIGIGREDLRWRKNQYRDHEIDGIPRREFGAGVLANVDAIARLGLLYLREGRWRDAQILSPEFVHLATSTQTQVVGKKSHDDKHFGAANHYGLLWWNNADAALSSIPRDSYWAWGLFDSLIVVMPSLDLVAVRGGEQGRSWPRETNEAPYQSLEPFLRPIAVACGFDSAAAPYPYSDVVDGVTWSAPDPIRRSAKGSDNWPMTWTDNDQLITAYGDGHGFTPRPPQKLSLGLSVVKGSPSDFVGENLESNVTQLGDGKSGRKASGLLMVDGVLYMFVRNADNSQLAWSADRGHTWEWADWRFETSFGCPTLLNYGQNYDGATDNYVYIYSFDSDSAYQPADRMVLARVGKSQLRDRDSYEFFVRRDKADKPVWSAKIEERGAVFQNSRNGNGQCYRSGLSYNSVLERYFWVQIVPNVDGEQVDTRFDGGFGIYESPNPWGPWRTVYYTSKWDVGPGESASFPTKWMSDDGREMHLVFSGDDSFSVRKVLLHTRR